MHRGYIKLWRKYQDNEFWRERRVFSKFEAWLDLITEAQHDEKEQFHIIGNHRISTKRGQLIKSKVTLALRWGWNRSKVRRFLDLLTKCSMIVTENVHKTTRISIINYDTYNCERPRNGHDLTTKRPRLDHDLTTDKNVKHVKNAKNVNNKTFSSRQSAEPVFDFEHERDILLTRYDADEQRLIDDCLKAIATTRQTGKIADSVIIKILKQWDSVSAEKVMAGIERYLDGGYHVDGKNERYLWGIIRNQEPGRVVRMPSKGVMPDGSMSVAAAKTLQIAKELANEF
jgi:hypothetical protein